MGVETYFLLFIREREKGGIKIYIKTEKHWHSARIAKEESSPSQ